MLKQPGLKYSDIFRQSLVKTFNISSKLLEFLIKVPHRNVGTSKRAKVPSSPTGKLGCVHSLNESSQTHTHTHTHTTLYEQNSLKILILSQCYNKSSINVGPRIMRGCF